MPIDSKHELKEYLEADALAQPLERGVKGAIKRLLLGGDKVYALKVHLRKCEYHHNVMRQVPLHVLAYVYHYVRLKRLSRSFCSEIPINVFGKGLVIWHPERIIVNDQSKVGDHCSLSSGVVIGQAHGGCPVIGDSVELMVDSKVLGSIRVADNVRIGADALVLKSIDQPNTTWGGVPARKISNKGTLDAPLPIGEKKARDM